jgi:N-acyl homoserine lactone hydrolase
MILAGHRVVQMHILDLGLFEVRGGERVIGIPGFLVTTDHGARILIDGGFPPAYAEDAEGAARADGLGAFGRLIDYGPRQTLPGQLSLLGLTPAAIELAILTHGHIDHVGALPLVRCPLVLTATERADPRPRYFGTMRPMEWPALPTHLIEAETDLCDGLHLIPTPGHTPGHLSLLVTLPSGPVILAADAVNRESEPAEGYPDAEDPAAAALSGAALMALREAQAARFVWGHDPEQWPCLPKAPSPLP